MNGFLEELHAGWENFRTSMMNNLEVGEELNLSLEAEDSLFLRFNKGKIRQNTQVEQNYLDLKFQKNGKTAMRQITLTSDLQENKIRGRKAIQDLRSESAFLQPDPFQTKMENRGGSQKNYPGQTPSAEILVQDITKSADNLDLVGFWSGGPRISANANSAGQNHWFSNQNFFFDYSIYDGERAIASNISGAEWNPEVLRADIVQGISTLKHLAKPVINLKPGRYRTYLAPIATAELLNMFNWQALGMGDYKRGRSSLKKIVEGVSKFSPLFSLRENFDLGLSPAFNSLGEVSKAQLSLIDQGQFIQLFTSTRSAKEYGVESNFAPPEEYGRSFEISPGTLAQSQALQVLGTGLFLSHLHYLNYSDVNAARLTGMTRYAALWVEGGEIQGPISNLRFDHSLIDLFGKDLINLTRERRIIPGLSTYSQRQLGGAQVPGALIEAMNFTL